MQLLGAALQEQHRAQALQHPRRRDIVLGTSWERDGGPHDARLNLPHHQRQHLDMGTAGILRDASCQEHGLL